MQIRNTERKPRIDSEPAPLPKDRIWVYQLKRKKAKQLTMIQYWKGNKAIKCFDDSRSHIRIVENDRWKECEAADTQRHSNSFRWPSSLLKGTKIVCRKRYRKHSSCEQFLKCSSQIVRKKITAVITTFLNMITKSQKTSSFIASEKARAFLESQWNR